MVENRNNFEEDIRSLIRSLRNKLKPGRLSIERLYKGKIVDNLNISQFIYIIFMLEKMNIIDRIETKIYDFRKEDLKKRYGKIKYFYYVMNSDWIRKIMYNEQELDDLVQLIGEKLRNNSIVEA
jgi:hypothetical protein